MPPQLVEDVVGNCEKPGPAGVKGQGAPEMIVVSDGDAVVGGAWDPGLLLAHYQGYTHRRLVFQIG